MVVQVEIFVLDAMTVRESPSRKRKAILGDALVFFCDLIQHHPFSSFPSVNCTFCQFGRSANRHKNDLKLSPKSRRCESTFWILLFRDMFFM